MKKPVDRQPSVRVTSRALLVLLLALLAASGSGASPIDSLLVDPEEAYRALDIRVTGGAAPGYVNDRTCSHCHAEIYRSFQSVAMAKSFYRPTSRAPIEDFDNNHFFHPPSQRHYELSVRDGEYWFRRWQVDDAGEPINEFETKVDWVLGSGNHVRTYLYQNESGELYQLPLGWYSQEGKWEMQPGYEAARHLGVSRQIRRPCMFCHNAYPDVPKGSDQHLEPHRFPKDLPEGIGCQRCHGPGDAHVRTLLSGVADLEKIRSSIVNPGKLSPQRRDDVCFECHMLPAVAVTPIRRFERADYSFRPGQDLAEYMVVYDIRESGKDPGERFEINHHPYRLRQSRCYAESGGELSCLTCHDPHRKIPPEQRAEHYRSKCLGCHQESSHPPPADAEDGVESRMGLTDCAGCHMPETRTQDVIHVTMTDHRIRIVEQPQTLLAPLEKTKPQIAEILFLEPERAPAGDLGEIYRILGVVRPSEGQASEPMQKLAQLLRKSLVASSIPYLDLVRGLLYRRQYDTALEVLEAVDAALGETPHSLEWSAVALLGQGQLAAAEQRLLRALELRPERPETLFNLALILNTNEDLDAAEKRLKQAVALQPNLSKAWHYLGEVNSKAGRPAAAVDSYRRALSIDPTFTRAYLGIGQALKEVGDPREARRYLRHGIRHARKPELVEAALRDFPEPNDASAARIPDS